MMDSTADTSRLFLAVPSCPELPVALNRLKAINSGLTGTHWVKEENLHLTVFFIGDVTNAHKQELMKVLAEHPVRMIDPFHLRFKSVTLEGGRPGRPSMVWARFEEHDGFKQLSQSIGNALSSFLKEPPRFTNPVPHVTLARIRSGNLPELNVTVQCSVQVNGFELWETVRNKDGVSYRVIEKYYPF